jgi:DNA anti-recombination protein RmuC
MEAEGERLVKGFMALVQKHVPETQRKAFERLAQQAVNLLSQSNKAMEESAKRVIERLNLPTRKDFETYNRKLEAVTKKWREGVEGGVQKGLSPFHTRTRRELDNLAKGVGKLREDVDALLESVTMTKKGAPKRATRESGAEGT